MKRVPPRGFQIQLDTLARHKPFPRELPSIGGRLTGRSRANWRNGIRFVHQMAGIRVGRLTRFAVVGALGTVLNLAVMALLVHGVLNLNYVVAAVIAAELSILHNFLLQERFVFRDLRDGVNSWRDRLIQHMLFNNAEAMVRLTFLILLVETMHVWALLAQAITLASAFVARFLFMTRVIYRPTSAKRAARHCVPRNRVSEVSV